MIYLKIHTFHPIYPINTVNGVYILSYPLVELLILFCNNKLRVSPLDTSRYTLLTQSRLFIAVYCCQLLLPPLPFLACPLPAHRQQLNFSVCVREWLPLLASIISRCTRIYSTVQLIEAKNFGITKDKDDQLR